MLCQLYVDLCISFYTSQVEEVLPLFLEEGLRDGQLLALHRVLDQDEDLEMEICQMVDRALLYIQYADCCSLIIG